MAGFLPLTRGCSPQASRAPHEPQFPTSFSTTQPRRPSFSSFLLSLVLPGSVSLINYLCYGTQGQRLFPQKNQWKKQCMTEERWGERGFIQRPRNGEEGASWLQGVEGYRHRPGIVRGRGQYRGGIPTHLSGNTQRSSRNLGPPLILLVLLWCSCAWQLAGPGQVSPLL